MATIDWKQILQQHPVFSELREMEIDHLLDEGVSAERDCPENHVIVREGELDESIYLIGSGAADVFLSAADNQKILLNTLKKGDFFGEMALFEQSTRSATVITIEHSKLLQFNGKKFITLLRAHPEIGFRLLVKLSERLRDLGDHVLSVKLKDVDEKIKHINAKLDSELRVVDASLKATQTVFEQTSKRANEIIESADRSRTRFTFAASAIGTVFTGILSILSLIGYSEVQKVDVITENISDKAAEVTNTIKTIENLSAGAEQHADSIETTIEKIDQVTTKLEVVNNQIKSYSKRMVARFPDEVTTDIEEAKKTYSTLLKLEDEDVTNELYRNIVSAILYGDKNTRDIYITILKTGIEDNQALTSRQKILSHRLLLSTYILNDKEADYYLNLPKYKIALKEVTEPIKENTEVDFGALVFEEYINEDAKTMSAAEAAAETKKIDKIETVWNMLP